MKILLSIKPEYVEKIFNGKKKFEYRKVLFNDTRVTTVVVYSTMPVGRIVGEFQIKRIHQDSPQSLWSKTQEFAGVDSVFFRDYFHGRESGYAIEIGHVSQYENPIDPRKAFEKFTAPQSFCYFREPSESDAVLS